MNKPNITDERQAFNDGVKARHRNIPSANNPYNEISNQVEHDEWNRGYRSADKAIESTFALLMT